ncbi:hypothetical protein GW17_00024057 [Ensete ventricosum]|nr:hypothetical protein GW17_00024057 [Ensete ventricosum]
MDGHGDTSEEATSARGTKSAVDLESEVEVPEHDTAHAPCRCNRTSSVRLGHIPRDCRSKTLTPAAGKGGLSLRGSDFLFSSTPNFTLPRGPFRILANLGVGRASLGHPSHLQRGLCAGSSSPRRPEGPADRALRRGPPREHQSTQEVSTPTDVGGLTHSDENRSSRHLNSTPESFVTLMNNE